MFYLKGLLVARQLLSIAGSFTFTDIKMHQLMRNEQAWLARSDLLLLRKCRAVMPS